MVSRKKGAGLLPKVRIAPARPRQMVAPAPEKAVSATSGKLNMNSAPMKKLMSA